MLVTSDFHELQVEDPAFSEIQGILRAYRYGRRWDTVFRRNMQNVQRGDLELTLYFRNIDDTGDTIALLGTGGIIVNRRFYRMNYHVQQAMIQEILSVLEISS